MVCHVVVKIRTIAICFYKVFSYAFMFFISILINFFHFLGIDFSLSQTHLPCRYLRRGDGSFLKEYVFYRLDGIKNAIFIE